ncbi:hypothetical protein DM02DRAFT_612696 [Periconia macrospinosa]|uniref:Spo12-like protein n=1 Tax=Periconia macrospinosa TaxID=97972 RepID=A0A2V1DWI5_9PLEO|nr:hypothetical protein DM02DRAFT_612696 [Periconia macrospinosa]
MTAANVLGDRDANVRITASPEKEKPKSMEYHRQMLQTRLDEKKPQQFVSPSDAIMSPATKKLSAHRGRNILKNSKPKTLFMQTSSKNHKAAKDVAAFDDIPKDSSKGDESETKPV